YAQAQLLLERALKIEENVLGKKHIRVAGILENKAIIYKLQGHYTQAQLLLKRVLNIEAHIFGKEHLKIAQSLNNLARLYESQDEYRLAKRTYERALKILEKVMRPEHPLVAHDLSQLAELYGDVLSEYDPARSRLERAIRTSIDQLGATHDVAVILENYALLLMKRIREQMSLEKP
ncbi:MAG: tetratricopeptide repeat protein, partial [Pseudomonadota bacterium]|nr:tetratricopeptide repeat protein [Pseudomonadota bacterium]